MNPKFRLFLGCFMALIATAFGFAVRGAILNVWGEQFSLSEEQKGIIQGVGLYPFAISIILLSLIIDRIGYGVAMIFAFAGHVISCILTVFAVAVATKLNTTPFAVLYVATFIFALANGVVEAVINPVVATMYSENKTKWLNILHAGWPGGLVFGGLLAIAVLKSGQAIGNTLHGDIWQWQMALVMIPTLLYGIILAGQKFPLQERVAAGVSYMDMLREFGWGSSYICSFLLLAGVNQILVVFTSTHEPAMSMTMIAGIAVVPTILFALYVRSFGRPMFVFLLFVMLLLATTELGTDSWISGIMQRVLESPVKGTLFLVYTSLIMFILRFFAGPIVHRISPLGLLAACAAIACGGLYWLGNAGPAVGMLFAAATLYGVGKTFFWPTTLGVVTEQYPKGGALMLNAIAGVGMLSVGVLGGPIIGTVQDVDVAHRLEVHDKQLYDKVVDEKKGQFFDYKAVDLKKKNELPQDQQAVVQGVERQASQMALAKIAVLPGIMFLCYLLLIGYFRSKGGYKAEVLTGHGADDQKFTGGIQAPMEA